MKVLFRVVALPFFLLNTFIDGCISGHRWWNNKLYAYKTRGKKP